MIGIRVNDQLRVRQVLLKDVRIHRGDDDVGAAVDDQRRLLDRFQIIENVLGRRTIFADGLALCRRRFVAHFGIAILDESLAFEKGEACGLARRRRREENRKPKMLGRIIGPAEDLSGSAPCPVGAARPGPDQNQPANEIGRLGVIS